MKSDCRLATILAHAGIKSDEATGALAAPIHFPQLINTQSWKINRF